MKPQTRRTPAAMSHAFGWQTRTEIALSADQLESLRVHAGDLLRSEEGTVWATTEGQWQDIVLQPGQTHEVVSGATLHVSGFDSARLVVIGRAATRRHAGVASVGAMLQGAWARLQACLRASSFGPVQA